MRKWKKEFLIVVIIYDLIEFMILKKMNLFEKSQTNLFLRKIFKYKKILFPNLTLIFLKSFCLSIRLFNLVYLQYAKKAFICIISYRRSHEISSN